MAARQNKRKVTGRAVKLPPPPDDMEESEFPDALAYLKTLGAQDGIEWDIRVYQIVGGAGRGGGRQPFLFSVQIENLPTLEEQLADLYPGGGTFRVMCRADGRVVKAAMLEIAPRPGYKPPPPSYLVAPTSVQGTIENSSNGVEHLVRAMMEENRRFMEAVIAKISAPAAPVTTIKDQIDMLSQIQGLLPKGAQENSMDMFKQGMDLAEKIYSSSERGGGGSSLIDLAGRLLEAPAFGEAIKAFATVIANPQTQQQPQLGAPGGAPQNLAPAKNPELLNIVETLNGQAGAGVDPAMVARQALASIPPAILQQLELYQDILAFLENEFPQIRAHHDWWAALIANMWDEGQPEADAARSPFLAGNQRTAEPDVNSAEGPGGNARNP